MSEIKTRYYRLNGQPITITEDETDKIITQDKAFIFLTVDVDCIDFIRRLIERKYLSALVLNNTRFERAFDSRGNITGPNKYYPQNNVDYIKANMSYVDAIFEKYDEILARELKNQNIDFYIVNYECENQERKYQSKRDQLMDIFNGDEESVDELLKEYHDNIEKILNSIPKDRIITLKHGHPLMDYLAYKEFTICNMVDINNIDLTIHNRQKLAIIK